MTNFIISLAWLLIFRLSSSVHCLGSMGTMAASYGDNGATLCGLSADGSHYAECYGGDAAIVYAAPLRMPFEGLSAGAGFVCGIQITTRQPYCWGNSFYVRMGIPQPLPRGIAYAEVSAGDHHFCALRAEGFDIVDCWGYNMTGSLAFGSSLRSLSSGSMFSCAVFVANGTAVCWGDETGSGVVSLLPKHVRFKSVSAGGYYVCGIDTEDKTLCWGQSMVDVGLPREKMSYIVGGRFQACGILSQTRGIVCWGLVIPGNPTKPPLVRFASIVAGDYFACGIVAGSTNTVCWGADCPKSGPLAVTPMSCSQVPCADGSFNDPKQCEAPYHACVPCSVSCPDGMRVVKECSGVTDRVCGFVCSVCDGNVECVQHCAKRKRRFSFHGLLIVAVLSVLIVVASVCTFVIAFCLKMRSCSPAPLPKTPKRTRPPKICRAQVFSYVELERATGGFCKDSEVGRGSYSCVFKGELSDGRVVAVKRAMIAGNTKRDSKEFHREVDLLSRLNHAHLLNLLGYCEEGGERLLVYEYMAHGSLHEHLHGNSKEKLDWIRRVTIAVQAARGLEYLHGYACPPVIHRDIKSSNILIDEERNARVADFGLSLLGPVDSDTPLSELPAGTLGYLDPEYYRLHYLTTKSDVYSFGVLLLEILSGRKAIDMRYEPGNIVEWAVPLVKTKDIEALLDSRLDPPDNIDALHRIARVACRCVRMRGKERPSMDKVTTSLERSLAQLMGTPCDDQPILPTEVVLGSSRLHNKSSGSHDLELRAPSWITFPSVASSQRRKSSVSEDTKAIVAAEDHKREKERDKDRLSEEEQDEIRSVSPQRDLYLQNNF